MAAGTKMLSELGLTPLGGPDRAVSGLSVDSRLVKPGHLFAALPGLLMVYTSRNSYKMSLE